MRAHLFFATAWIALLSACGSPPSPEAEAGPAADLRVIRELPAGTVVRLLPVSVATSGDPVSAAFVDANLREALRLSDHLDIAGALEDMPSAELALRPRIDAAADVLTIALVSASDDATVPLGASSYANRPLPNAIDELALQVRVALGERVRTEPPSCAEIYSASPTAVRETEAALLDENRGLHGARRERLERALRSDPGCTLARALQAASALLAGNLVEAERIAEATLRVLPGRTSPTTEQRLRRVLWLARGAAATEPDAARRADEELLQSAESFLAERPYDPHGRYSRALANANLGRFDLAVADLRELRTRWPLVPWVAYHLAFAELATGDPEAALEQLETGARRLSNAWTVLPRALALYEAGHHEELTRELERMATRRRDRTDDVTLHEIRRMLSSHAILTDRPDDAARHLLDDLEWLRERPSLLDRFADDLADDGAALFALGRKDELALRLRAIRSLPVETPNARLAWTFLEGLLAIDSDPSELRRAIEVLEAAGQPATAARLAAVALLAEGEASRAVERLERALVFGDDLRLRALLAVAQRDAGQIEAAERTAGAVRTRLSTLRLRGTIEHPLLGPGFALAWRLAGGDAPVKREA